MAQNGRDSGAGKVLLVASGKGGAGKSTLSVNCGAALAQRGNKVLLIDADIGLRSLDLMLGVSDRVIYDLGDVLAGNCEPGRAIIVTDYHDLHLLPAPQVELLKAVDAETMRELFRGLSRYYDYVILDSPAGVGFGLTTPAGAADTALVVANPDPVSIRDAERAAQVLRNHNVPEIRLIINRVNSKMIRKKVLPNLDEVIDGTSIRLLGAVPEDRHVLEAAAAGRPVIVLRKGAAMAFRNIAARIDGEDVPLMKL